MKKLLAIVISMAMIVAMMPVGVFAGIEGESGTEANPRKVSNASELKSAMEAGGCVQLAENIELNEKLSIDSNVTLDLNGKKIDSKYCGWTINIATGAELTINDGDANNAGGIICNTSTGSGSETCFILRNEGKLTVNGGTFGDSNTDKADNNTNNRGAAVINNGGNVTINGGNFTCGDNYWMMPAVTNGNKFSYAIRNYGGTMTINGGTVYGKMNGGIAADGGTVTINNVEVDISGDKSYACLSTYSSGGKFIVNGGTFKKSGNNNPILNSFTGMPSWDATNDLEENGYSIYGGTFIVNDVEQEIVPVAENNGKKYGSLKAAIAAASDRATVKLIKDIKEDITVPAGKSIILDLNNNNLTNNSRDTITVAKGATLTVEGTGVVDNKTHTKAAIFNNGTVTLNGGTYDRTEEKSTSKTDNGGNSCYTIINHGTMTINDGVTVQTAKNDTAKGKYSSLVENGYQDYSKQYNEETNDANPELTINGGDFFGGLNTVKNDDGAELTIKNGNFENYYQASVQNHNIAIITGGTFISAGAEAAILNCGVKECSIVEKDKHSLTISGGIFKGNITKTVGTVSITGGTFSTSPKAYVAGGNKVYKFSDTEYKVSAESAQPSAPAGYRWKDATGEDLNVCDYITEVIPYTPSTPATPADNVTNNTTDKKTTADLAPAVKDNKAETTVDAKTADKIVDKAVANKSTEVIVDATGNNTVASSEVAIPEKTVKEIAEKTDASLVIKTDNGKVDLDKTAVKALADQAGTTGTVKLIVETVKNDADICHVNLKLVTSNGAVTDFRGGNVKVTINLTKELAAKDVVCVYINDNGIYTLVEGVLNADGTYTFTTGHFSEYAVMAKAEADKKIAEQLDTMIKDVNLKVRTSKTAKKNIKAVVSGDITALTDAGYTVKYKFYRSEKKASKYVSKREKTADTYINTAGKKGTKYYYKAKAMVYSGDTLVGQTALKQCKYGVRTWSK